MSQDYGKIWVASLVHDLFIGIHLVRIFSSMLQEGEVNLEKSAITLKYAMDAERILEENIKLSPCSASKLWWLEMFQLTVDHNWRQGK